MLSPKAHDALLVWNFFDSALQQKEHFSGYVFEDTAEDLLQGDEALRMRYAAAQKFVGLIERRGAAQALALRRDCHWDASVFNRPELPTSGAWR